ncbi:MAG: outer membrane protein assembly factor BamA [Candidatus Azotimanducaceae bacterium]|jgi:outer membrane protein assembly factor BamA
MSHSQGSLRLLLIQVIASAVLGSLPIAAYSAEPTKEPTKEPTSETSSETTCTDEFQPVTADFDFHRTNLTDLKNKKIDQVYITRLPIFDESNEDENNWLYRLANRIHSLTREDHVRELLLFDQDSDYVAREIQESARILRNQGHLYDANIHRVSTCDDSVDLEVVTRDVWSLTLDTSFARSGGENDYRFGIGENNLFGTGQKIAVFTEEDDERQSTSFSYQDRNVRGSRIRTSLLLQDSDDGDLYGAQVFLPFYALDTRRAWGISANQTERIDTQYFRGEDVSEVQHDIKDFSVFYGFSKGLVDGKARRLSIGYRYRDENFEPTADLPPPATLPISKELSYPFVNLEIVEDNYTTAFNLDQINRTEDLHLGYTLNVNFGYAADGFGSDQDRLVYGGIFSDTILYTKKVLLRHELKWEGINNYDTDRSEDVVVNYDMTYFRSQTTHRSFFAELKLLWTENLDSHRQILLGGENGVRGYDRRLQSGDRSVVLTLEERQYTNYHPLNLAYLGFAVFIDIGRAWNPDFDEGFEDDYLASAGFGIRLASSKSDSSRVIHIDFAFPLTNRDEPEVDSSDISINIKSSL